MRHALDPATVTTYDWVHTCLQNGVFQSEVDGLMAAAAGHGVTRTAIQAFLRDTSWRFPKSMSVKSKQLHRVFDERRQAAGSPDRMRCTCSEALGVYNLMRLAPQNLKATWFNCRCVLSQFKSSQRELNQLGFGF